MIRGKKIAYIKSYNNLNIKQKNKLFIYIETNICKIKLKKVFPFLILFIKIKKKSRAWYITNVTLSPINVKNLYYNLYIYTYIYIYQIHSNPNKIK